MSRHLAELTALSEALSSESSTHKGPFTPAYNLVPWDQTPPSGLEEHLYADTHILINLQHWNVLIKSLP